MITRIMSMNTIIITTMNMTMSTITSTTMNIIMTMSIITTTAAWRISPLSSIR